MFWAVLAPAAYVRFDDVAAVEEGHFAVGFDPDFVARVWGDNVEGGYVQAKFGGFGKLAWAIGVSFRAGMMVLSVWCTDLDRCRRRGDWGVRCWWLDWRGIRACSRRAIGAFGIHIGFLPWTRRRGLAL